MNKRTRNGGVVPFVLTALFALFLYLLLTAGSGNLGWWSPEELVMGLLLSLVVGAVTAPYFCRTQNYRMIHPLRWAMLLVYAAVPFLLEMSKANLEVAYRVITGRIRPGIVRVTSNLKTDLGIVMLADSITLTPGTLSVDIDEKTHDLFVHIIYIPEGEEKREAWTDHELFKIADLPSWIRRIAE
jgi:multicomponent Na+:H+ antiporter subunit E